jgi:hypothetical protein
MATHADRSVVLHESGGNRVLLLQRNLDSLEHEERRVDGWALPARGVGRKRRLVHEPHLHPGLETNSNPFGWWYGISLLATAGWTNGRDLNDADLGALIVVPETGSANLQDTVGAWG